MSFKVGDNVVLKNVKDDDDEVPPASPGVIVGYIVFYPNEVHPLPWIADEDEMTAAPKVYDLKELVPDGETAASIFAKKLMEVQEGQK
jgi:hypothetical protein